MAQTEMRSRRLVLGIQVAGPVLGVGLLLLGIIVAGQFLRERLRPLDSQTIAFAEIECPAPPGKTRGDFLTEVQYLGDEPDRLRLLDDNLVARLAGAFAHHPAVEKVERVEILPGRHVRVQLAFRPGKP